MNNKYYCRNCYGLRNHKILSEKKTNGSEDSFEWNDDYYIIQCYGCETVAFLKVYGDSEMMRDDEYDEYGNMNYYDKKTIFPSYLEKGKEIEHLFYLPHKIRTIYTETISAFKANAFILTAGGFRAIIEALCNHLDIRKDDLSKRIDLLYASGLLSLNESKRLHSIRFLGNDALHELETPKIEQLVVLLEIINHLLENLFIQDRKIGHHVDTIIDSYKDFIKLLSNKLSKEELNKEKSLNQLLGKSRRLIKEGEFKNFESKLKEDIKNKNFDFLTVVEVHDKVSYIVLKLPNFTFDY